jgi:RES domain-containing protein
MALAWRLADPRFAEDLQGTGNRLTGARWNSPGRGVLYCSENLSLCVLENLVHLNPVMRGSLPRRAAICIEFPDDAEITEVKRLPKDCRKAGDRWLGAGRSLVLRAPSIVVPLEMNLMFNPLHPLMQKVRIVRRVPFRFDGRLKGHRTA